MTDRQTLLDWCDATLETARFKDYAPNGLQVEGRTAIRRILTAVTASRAAIDHAVATGADMLLVHHGMFWKSEPATITGWKKQRIAALLAHDINLAGYHLPLDAHPELGNNAQLAKRCGWLLEYRFGDQDLLMAGRNGKRGQPSPASPTTSPPPSAAVPPSPATPSACSTNWCGAAAALRAIFRLPSTTAPTPTSQAKSPKPNTIWPTKPAPSLSAPATTPPNATASKPSGAPSPTLSASKSAFSTKPIQPKAA